MLVEMSTFESCGIKEGRKIFLLNCFQKQFQSWLRFYLSLNGTNKTNFSSKLTQSKTSFPLFSPINIISRLSESKTNRNLYVFIHPSNKMCGARVGSWTWISTHCNGDFYLLPNCPIFVLPTLSEKQKLTLFCAMKL